MNTTLDASTSPTESRQHPGDRIQSPPAFLDLADSVRPVFPCNPPTQQRSTDICPFRYLFRLRGSVLMFPTCLLWVLHLVDEPVMFA